MFIIFETQFKNIIRIVDVTKIKTAYHHDIYNRFITLIFPSIHLMALARSKDVMTAGGQF